MNELIEYIKKNDVKSVKNIIHRVHKDVFKKRENPLMLACHLGYVEIVRILLTHKYVRISELGEPSIYDPLNKAVYHGNILITTMLIKHPSFDQNQDNHTPFYYSIRNDDMNMFKLLIKHGIKPKNAEFNNVITYANIKFKYIYILLSMFSYLRLNPVMYHGNKNILRLNYKTLYVKKNYYDKRF